MTIETVEERQARYLAVLRQTGSHVRARAAAGVGARAVGKWRENEAFAEAEVEAAEFALDSVVQASRAAALAGDSSQMTNWMKLAHAELRPQSSVNVGVAVNNQSAHIDSLSDDELWQRVEQLRQDRIMRGEIVDVEALPAPPVDPESLL